MKFFSLLTDGCVSFMLLHPSLSLGTFTFLTCQIFVFPRRPFQIAASWRSWSTRSPTRLNWLAGWIGGTVFASLPNCALSIAHADIHTHSTLASFGHPCTPLIVLIYLTNPSVHLWSMDMQSPRPRTLPHVPARMPVCTLCFLATHRPINQPINPSNNGSSRLKGSRKTSSSKSRIT